MCYILQLMLCILEVEISVSIMWCPTFSEFNVRELM